MKIVVNAMELGNEQDFSIKGDFKHLVDSGVLPQFVDQLQDKIAEMDRNSMRPLSKNAQSQEKMYSIILPQDLRSKLRKTYDILKEKGEDELSENIEALACHFMDLEQALMNQKNHINFIESRQSFPRPVNPHSNLYQTPGPCNSYDPNHGMIYAQMRPVPGFEINHYNLSPWEGSPVEQYKMARFFKDMMTHYLNSLYMIDNKDFEVKYYISKTLYEIQRVQEIIMDFYRGNDRFETRRDDLEGIFEIIFYCNKQIRKLIPENNIMELKKDVFDKFRADLENTFVQLKK